MTNRYQEPEFNIWREEWPRDPRNEEFVFLARAVEAVGTFLFPSWTHSDPLSNGDGYKRYEDVQEWIATKIATEKLPYVLISPTGVVRKAREQMKGYSEFGASDWNVADVRPFFRTCKMPGTRFRSPERASPEDWIYVDRAALSRLMPASNRSPLAVASDTVIEDWFRKEIVAPWEENPLLETRPVVREVVKLAKVRFPGVAKNKVEDVYSRLKPPEWVKKRPSEAKKPD
jgi:hypothetical protein